MKVSELIKSITSVRQVSENSIKTYASHHTFYSPKRGEIRLRKSDDPWNKNQSSINAEQLLARPQIIIDNNAPSLPIKVDKEMLRGSGRPTLTMIARYLKMQPGDTRTFNVLNNQFELGIRWSTAQPAFRSLRKISEHLDAKLGDTLLIRFVSSDEIDIRLIQQ